MANNSEGQGDFGKRADAPRRENSLKTAGEALRPMPGTPQPPRSRHSRNRFVVFLNFLLSCLVLLVAAAGAAVYIGKHEFEANGPTQEDRMVMVKRDIGVGRIASMLEGEGVIRDSLIFRLGVRAYGNDDKLKAGEYEVEAGASMHDIMDLLKSGKSVMHSVTIPEGLTVAQAFERIAETEELSGKLPQELPPEGSIAADTIRFTRGMSRKQVLDTLEAMQKKRIADAWAERDKDIPIDNVEDFVILASIVEKETGIAEERSRVAAVFLNRLRKGMRLQSDPTIIYGLFGGEGKPVDRPIYQSDIDKKTPYNTYQIDGLPPTPIANPGLAALKAVANPAETDDLYFVADGSGGHVFSTTLDDHNKNVARWRQLKKKQEAAQKVDAEKPAAKD